MSVGAKLGDQPVVRARFGDSESLMKKFKVSKHLIGLAKGYALNDSLEANTNHLRNLNDTIPPSPDYAKMTLASERVLKKTERLHNKMDRARKEQAQYAAAHVDNDDNANDENMKLGAVLPARYGTSNMRSTHDPRPFQDQSAGMHAKVPAATRQNSMGPPAFPSQRPFLASGYSSDTPNMHHRQQQPHRHPSQPIAGSSRLPSASSQPAGHYVGGSPHPYHLPPPPNPHGYYIKYCHVANGKGVGPSSVPSSTTFHHCLLSCHMVSQYSSSR
jgi:hypothetical protein